MPPYADAVPTMVVPGEAPACGLAERSVYVRQPLTLLSTLPCVDGLEGEVTMPVSILVMQQSIKEVTPKL